MRRLYVYILLIISFLFVLFGALIGQKKWIEHKQRVQQRVFFENMYAGSDCIKNVILKNGMYIDPIVFYSVFVANRVVKWLVIGFDGRNRQLQNRDDTIATVHAPHRVAMGALRVFV